MAPSHRRSRYTLQIVRQSVWGELSGIWQKLIIIIIIVVVVVVVLHAHAGGNCSATLCQRSRSWAQCWADNSPKFCRLMCCAIVGPIVHSQVRRGSSRSPFRGSLILPAKARTCVVLRTSSVVRPWSFLCYYGGTHQRSFERYHPRPPTASSSARLGVRNPNPKQQPLLSQERVKLRTSNFVRTFLVWIGTKAH